MVYKLFKKSETIRNVSTLVLGTGISQAILFLISPVFTRIYTPVNFASLTLFTSVVAIASVLATCRFEYAIVLPKEDNEARQIMRLALSICSVVSLTFLALLFLYDFSIPDARKAGAFNNLFYLAPVAIFLSGLSSVFNFWSTRKKTFLINATSRISSAVSHAIIGTGAGLLKFTSVGLIFASLGSYLVSVFITGYEFIKKPSLLVAGTSKEKMRTAFHKYRDFAFINTPHAFVDTLLDSGLFFLLAYFFESWIVGLYAFSYRLLKAPAGLIGSSLYQVLFQRMSEAKSNDADLRPLVLRIYRNLFLMGIIPVVLFLVFAPELFLFVFGNGWKEAGEISQVILPWIFLNFLITPVSSLPIINGKQKLAFQLTLIDMVLRFSGIVIGGLYHNYILSFTLLSIFGSMTMIFGLFWYYRLARPSRSEFFNQ